MANLVPENLRSRAGVPESVRALAGLIQDTTASDVIVTYDVEKPDAPLWISDPSRGIAGVFVVDGGRRNLRARLREALGNDVAVPELLAQAATEAADVVDRVLESPHLEQPVEPRVVVALPLVRRRDIEKEGVDPRSVLTKEDIGPDAIADALARVMDDGRALTSHEVSAVRAAVEPRIIIRDSRADRRDRSGIAFRATGEDPEADLAVLDLKQQQLALHLGDGYRVIRGVAGSGKSLILTARAKHLVDQDPSKRVLITCYNVIIAAALGAEVAQYENITVMNIDAYAWRVFKDSRKPEPPKDDPAKWDKYRAIAAKHLASGRASASLLYNAVLVDEGQDFDPLMLDVAFGALKAPDGDFIVVLDGVQNIYRRFGKAWRANGKTAQGRTHVLSVNYRNTHEILDLAYLLLLDGNANDSSGEGAIQQDEDIVFPEATSRRGPDPRIISTSSIDAEIAEACDQLETWRSSGAPWGEMLVLLGNQQKYQGGLKSECKARGIPFFFAGFSSKNKRQIIEAGDVVRAATVLSAKGIEFPHVVVLGVNQLTAGPEADETDLRRLAYVAMTRATHDLTMILCGDGPVGRDLLAVGS